MVRSQLFGVRLDSLSEAGHVGLLAKLITNQPEPSWTMLVQLLLCRNMVVAKSVLLHFGSFVPSVKAMEMSDSKGCMGHHCVGDCQGAPADVFWPHAVGSAMLRGGQNSSNLSNS
jgi:hypothetical protein